MGSSHSTPVGNTPTPTLGDLWYYDNPKRRNRAAELSNDIVEYGGWFKEAKKALDDLEPHIRERIETYLKQHNFTTLEDLVKKVEGTLQGDAMTQWQKLRSNLSQSHWLDNYILTVSGIVALGAGVVIGGLVLFSVISGPLGWAVFAGVSGAVGAVTTFSAFWNVFSGKQERDDLRNAVNKLAFARFDVCQSLRKLEVYKDWIISLSKWFDDNWTKIDPNHFEENFGQGFRDAAKKYEKQNILNELNKKDDDRHSWRNEDPNMDNVPSSSMIALPPPDILPPPEVVPAEETTMPAAADAAEDSAPVDQAGAPAAPEPAPVPMPVFEGTIHVLVTPESGAAKKMELELEKVISRTHCVARDVTTNSTIGIYAYRKDHTKPVMGLDDVKFVLTNLDTSEALQNCTMAIQAPVA